MSGKPTGYFSGTYDLAELGQFHRDYQALMAHWRTVLPASHFIEVDYEAMVDDLEREARRLLESGEPEVWDALTRQFEGRLIHTALDLTRGRRIEAAQKLGIGRNTITRKIQELGLDD